MTDTAFVLHLAHPAELRLWLDLTATEELPHIELEVDRWWPDTDAFLALVLPSHTPALNHLKLHSDACVPTKVIAAIAQRELQALELSGRGIGDVQVEALCASTSLNGLEQLVLSSPDRLSLQGWSRLTEAPWVQGLRSLKICLAALDDLALERLAAVPWRRLERLAVIMNVGRASEAGVAACAKALGERFSFDRVAEAINPAPLPPPESARWTEARTLARELAEASTGRWQTLSSLLQIADDDGWASETASEILSATAAWPLDACAADELWTTQEAERPWIQLPRRLRARGGTPFELLAAISASQWTNRIEWLDILVVSWQPPIESTWIGGWPALRSLRLAFHGDGRHWRTLAQMPLPPSVVHVDLSQIAATWLDEDHDVGSLRAVTHAWPQVRTLDLGRGWWSTGAYSRDFAGWVEPDKDGILRLT
ncbi:hypothetical protein DB30_02784 [Enhygromyxa salina]|uniref:Leucine Rich repeats (2 copies) n=2 Tax=Enhygromyxa salina TaxID=215803 RepID=A0A0C2D3G8_9BACT|nr:hypothetical protein DB30_02784 [Enhygromyxa salina]